MSSRIAKRHSAAAASLLLLIPLLLSRPAELPAGEIGFIEEFSLATDRAEALKQLIPGTEDYYFFHSLHYQNTGKLDEVEKLLGTWIERHGRTARVVEIENRQALLRYPDDPKRALELLRARLGLTFDQQRQARGEELKLPSRLDPALTSREALARRAFDLHRGTTDGLEDRALEAAAGLDLSPELRRHLLGRLVRPDIPDLPRLVTDDLKEKKSGGFGSLEIHRLLLLAQLDDCLRRKPDLLNDSNFINVYLVRLWPENGSDWRNDASARQAYLDRLWAFVSRLEPAHNSLKAHVLYHRLAHDLAQGAPDRERFLAYLKLPRNAPYMRRSYLEAPESRRAAADLGANFEAVTLLPPAGNDEPLVRAYLERWFASDDDTKLYEAYVSDTYLKRLFAETRIVLGLGDVETWSSMLSPAEFQALKERVDLDFVPTNKTVFGAEEQVALDLQVKGVKRLLVKVFELNALGYYERHLKEIDAAIDLDGLVANEESTHDFPEPELRRVARHFEFPSIARRGTYVVEFIGGGKSSRALIRKGRLRYLERTSTAGHVFTLLDEANRAVPEAAVWLAGHRYEADKEGLITVPFSGKPGKQPLVLISGDFASLDSFQHQAEAYELHAGFHVEREALLARSRASLLVRPSLVLNGAPVTLSVLEDPILVITSTDHVGVKTTKEIQGFALHEDRESIHEFQVPPSLAQLDFVLKAKVQNLSTGKKQDLAASGAVALNGIDMTEKIEDLHLIRAEGEYALDLLGRTGEAKAGRAVQLLLKHRDFRDLVGATLQSDANGRVGLGTLAGIEGLQATGPEGNARSWPLPRDRAAYPPSLHGRAGAALRLPFFPAADAVGSPGTELEFAL